MIETKPTGSAAAQAEQHAAAIPAALARAEASLSLEAVFEVEEHLLAMRNLAEADCARIAGRLDGLRDARARLERVKAPLAAALVDELARVLGALADLQHREDVLREAVVWLSRSTGQGTLRGDDARAEVRMDIRRTVPRAGSPGRTDLERAVRSTHVWDRVSILSGPRLEIQLRRQDFPPGARAAIEPLCPRRAVATVRVRGQRQGNRHGVACHAE